MNPGKLISVFFILLSLHAHLFSQRSPLIYTPSPQFLGTENIQPNFLSLPKNNLGIYRVEIFDNRFDAAKLGFKPEYKKAPRELKLTIPFGDAISKVFDDGLRLDQSKDKKLMVLIQDCRMSYAADANFNILKRNLRADLYYKFECFLAQDTNYFALKRINGTISMPYDENITCNLLIDSLFHLLQNEIAKLKITESEISRSPISETRFIQYLNNKKESLPRRIQYGVYASYDDFLKQNPITDSIDIIPYKDYGNRNVIAAHLGIVKNGLVEPCSKYWGFFDGRFLFYNTGNGFFIRMFPVNGQFVFADLQQLALSPKKKSITSEAMIGKTSYNMLKDFGKVFHLFFQVNYEDGSLY